MESHRRKLSNNVLLLLVVLANTAACVTPVFAQCPGAWVTVSPTGLLPAPRIDHAIAYDVARGQTLIYGGSAFIIGVLGDLWGWNGTAWTELSSGVGAGVPLRRAVTTLCYDSDRQVTVMFGGQNQVGLSQGDTWEWNGTSWIQRTLAVNPSSRHGHAMAYDAMRGEALLFGGSSGGNQTWAYSGNDWIQRTPPSSPAARGGHTMAYDVVRDVVVLFGGYNGSWLGDTWEWNGTNWVQRSTGGGPMNPAARTNHGMYYDSDRSRVVVFGGHNGANLADHWEWDGAVWTQLSIATPTARSTPATFDTARDRGVIFGGFTGSHDGTTWECAISTPPIITLQPVGGTVALADRFVLTTDVRGAQPGISFRWRRNGVNLSNDANKIGTDTPSMTILSAAETDAGTYDCVVSDGAPTCTTITNIAVINISTECSLTWRNVVQTPTAQTNELIYDAARRTVLNVATRADGQTVTYGWSGSEWVPMSVDPISQSFHMAAYDSVRQRVVLYSGAPYGTWEWDGASWTQVAANGPSPRTRGAMAYDVVRQRTVLYGGISTTSGAVFNDTWEWNGVSWTQISIPGPGPRRGQAMAYDAARGVVVLYGGTDGVTPTLDQTWTYNGVAWTQLVVPGPGPRRSVRMVYDNERARVVLFGGTSNGSASSAALLGDTWEWDGTTWFLRATSGPDPRYFAAMAFDAEAGRTMLYSGVNGAAANGLASHICDTWSWDGVSWTRLLHLPPVPDSGQSLVHDSFRSRSVLFGSWTAHAGIPGVFEWGGTDWNRIEPAGVEPFSAITLAAGAFDQSRARTVFFGGGLDGGVLSNDTWEWDGVEWTRFDSPGPSGRAGHAMVYQSNRSEILLFGGIVGGYSGETWIRSGTTWQQVASIGPGGRWLHAMAYDSARRRVVLFGGDNGSVLGDTWEWNGVAWSQVATTGPSPRRMAQMVYHPLRGKVVLIGGQASSFSPSPPLNDAWEWDGATWIALPLAGGAVSSKDSVLTFDTARSELVVHVPSDSRHTWVLSVPNGPAITQQPATIDACFGETAEFNVQVSGTGPISYRWRRNGQPLPGVDAFLPTYSIPAAGPADGGQYDCVIANACGSLTSDAVMLTVFGALPGDLTDDSVVDGNDIQAFVLAMGLTGSPNQAMCAADMDQNGTVDFEDVSQFVSILIEM